MSICDQSLPYVRAISPYQPGKPITQLAREMGMDSNHILISDIGKVIELTPNSAKINGTVPAGRVFVDGYGVGDVGSIVLRMIVIVGMWMGMRFGHGTQAAPALDNFKRPSIP